MQAICRVTSRDLKNEKAIRKVNLCLCFIKNSITPKKASIKQFSNTTFEVDNFFIQKFLLFISEFTKTFRGKLKMPFENIFLDIYSAFLALSLGLNPLNSYKISNYLIGLIEKELEKEIKGNYFNYLLENQKKISQVNGKENMIFRNALCAS